MTKRKYRDANLARSVLTQNNKAQPKPDVIVYGLLQAEWLGWWEKPYLTDEDGRVYVFQGVPGTIDRAEPDSNRWLHKTSTLDSVATEKFDTSMRQEAHVNGYRHGE
jgi:hypothetical protein